MNEENKNKWKGKTRGGLFGYSFFLFLIKLLGIRAAYVFLGLIVIYFIPFAPKATRASWRYARRILRYNFFRSLVFLYLSYYRFGQTLIDKVAVRSDFTEDYSFYFDDTLHEFLDTLDGNQGVILISAHVGNWEVGAPFFYEYGRKMNVVLYDAEYEKIKDLLSRQIKSADYKLIPVNEDDLTHVFQINNALKNKEYVCFQGDRFVEGSKTIRMQFMGQEADFPAGPFILASRLQVPVVFYFAVRGKGMRYDFIFVPAKPVEKGRQNKPETLLLEQYITTLESIVRKHPEQWFNYYDFWK